MKSWFLFFLIAFNTFYYNGNAQNEQDTSTLIQLEQQVPEFNFIDLKGISHNSSELKGKLVLLTFFATWCGPCMKELPHIQTAIYEPFQNNENFVLLVIGREHSAQEMQDFKDKKGFTFNVIADPKREIYSAFAKQFIPRNFLISREGKLIKSTIGFEEKEFEELRKTIADQLN